MGMCFLKKREGFTFPELLVASLLLAIAVVGLLLSYTKMIELQELSHNTSIAVEGIVDQMETVRNTSFGTISTTYNGQTFTVSGLTGMGIISVTILEADFLEVWLSYSWRQKNGRIIGEDSDLDGLLDSGEDANGNGRLDSPAQLVTYIYMQ